ncbi:MAG: DUF4954 family protein, partial [Bacteroidales bacterium]|nr:DUF4954 family protein [Bacteroidales bacterium]
MVSYRRLEASEIARLQAQMCTASDWDEIEVAEGFSTDYVGNVRFSGKIRLGVFRKE